MTEILDKTNALFRDANSRIVDRLDDGRSRLEERFLEGGEILSQALDATSEMIAVLDRVTSSLGQDSVNATVAELASTAEQLGTLPSVHSRRQCSMGELATASAAIQDDILTMIETLRYLRSFAVTVKITGAGAASFTAFADEMLDRIQSGRSEIDKFDSLLRELLAQVRGAVGLGHELDSQYEQTVPDLVRNLTADASRMGAYHGDMERVAGSLAELVRNVQGKVARVLSALQIGDMTRQRVEHVRAGLVMLNEAKASGGAPNRPELLALLADQMDDLLEEFQHKCGDVTSGLGGLAADVKEIVSLGRKARGGSDAGSGGFLQTLEENVIAARQLVGGIEEAGRRAAEVGQASADTADELTRKIDTVSQIRSDIQYMAINTSLRCSRMGDAGKPMNVVASELRVFSKQMETVSDRLLAGLSRLNDASRLSQQETAGAPLALGGRLDGALDTIKQASTRVAADFKELSVRGDMVARSVGQSVSRLDFSRELGDVLDECAVALAQAAADAATEPVTDAAAKSTHEIAQRIFALYTMARERNVHHRHFPEGQAAATPVSATATADMDDLDAVFF